MGARRCGVRCFLRVIPCGAYCFRAWGYLLSVSSSGESGLLVNMAFCIKAVFWKMQFSGCSAAYHKYKVKSRIVQVSLTIMQDFQKEN